MNPQERECDHELHVICRERDDLSDYWYEEIYESAKSLAHITNRVAAWFNDDECEIE